MIMRQERIACGLISHGDLDQFKGAVNCYLWQNYANRELVVLSQGSVEDNLRLTEYLRSLDRKDISFFEAPSSLSVGEMRNTIVDLAKGEVVCHWNEGDIYHPDRLRSQYKMLASHTQNMAAAYCEFLLCDGVSNEVFWAVSKTPLVDSLMFFKKVFHSYARFYPQHGNVIQKIRDRGKLVSCINGQEYVHFSHNESHEGHEGLSLTPVDQMGDKKELLRTTFNLVGLTMK